VELSGLNWLKPEQSALCVICQQIDQAIGPHAHIPNASRPTLKQPFFAQHLLTIEREANQHLAAQSAN
jgi:hypothetical protein